MTRRALLLSFIAAAAAVPSVVRPAGAVPPAGPRRDGPAPVVVIAERLPAPAWYREAVSETSRPVEASPSGFHTVLGRLSATEPRALADARRQLRREVSDWLAPDVPRSQAIPESLLKGMVIDTHVEPIKKEYGTVYQAALRADFSPASRARLLEACQQRLVMHRLVLLGGGLGFVLVCLAALNGYIRADEATRGYYTNRLRLAAAAAVGAAGMALYHALV